MNIYLLTSCSAIFALLCIEATENTPSEVNLAKRNLEELSYSYTATDIGSKTGTRIKTITVIKNKKHRTLKIDPELHRKENWGSEFRDSFDKYEKIPDIPEPFNKDANEPKETPHTTVNKKELIPIYETPDESDASTDDTTEGPTIQMPAEVTQETPTEEQVRTVDVLEKLPEDIELIHIGPINREQAKQSAKSQALHLKRYRTTERGHEGYLPSSPLHDYLQSLSKNYQFQPTQTNSPIEEQEQIFKQPRTRAESNTQSIFNNFPNMRHNPLQPASSTTVAYSYNALSKTIQFPKGNDNIQSQKNPDIYIAPALKALLTTVKPGLMVDDQRSASGTKNYQYLAQRTRGLRY